MTVITSFYFSYYFELALEGFCDFQVSFFSIEVTAARAPAAARLPIIRYLQLLLVLKVRSGYTHPSFARDVGELPDATPGYLLANPDF